MKCWQRKLGPGTKERRLETCLPHHKASAKKNGPKEKETEQVTAAWGTGGWVEGTGETLRTGVRDWREETGKLPSPTDEPWLNS